MILPKSVNKLSAVLPELRLRRNPRSRRVFKSLTCGHEPVKVYSIVVSRTQRWKTLIHSLQDNNTATILMHMSQKQYN